MNFGHASDGPDFDSDTDFKVSRNFNLLRFQDRFGKFDLALSQRLVESLESERLCCCTSESSWSSAMFLVGSQAAAAAMGSSSVRFTAAHTGRADPTDDA